MKKLLLMLCLLSMTAHAEKIKLQCDVISQITYQSGQPERQSGNAIIKIDTSPPMFIEVSSSIKLFDETSLVSFNIDDYRRRATFIDNSDSTRWEISNDTYYKEKNAYSQQRIMIDRNTGRIIYHDVFTTSKNYVINTDVSGTCTKVDTTKRKF